MVLIAKLFAMMIVDARLLMRKLILVTMTVHQTQVVRTVYVTVMKVRDLRTTDHIRHLNLVFVLIDDQSFVRKSLIQDLKAISFANKLVIHSLAL